MKKEILNCRECTLRRGNVCSMIVNKEIDEFERKIKDFSIVQEWCSVKGRNFIISKDNKIAIITRIDIDDEVETIEGYVEIFSGDEPKNYIYQKDREKTSNQKWIYNIIDKL